ncbi:MAG: periplasmic heavy metal sensor [Kiritimatiellae bacterium]|nr:periplasmic heavy metal sensor [Kiritimatiellia bacterium]MDD4735802.1 periplasmic heavy metal sensor [Kiritimatiellia bacterium]
MKRNGMVCLTALAVLTLATGVFARGPGACGPKKGGMDGSMRGIERLLDNEECMARLNITADQKKVLEEIALQFEVKEIALEAELKTAHLALRTLMKSQSDDREALFKAMDAVSASELKMKKAGMAAWLDIRSNLTEEQRTQIRKEMGAMRKGGMKNRENRKSGGKGRKSECGEGRPGTMGCGSMEGCPKAAPEQAP